MAVIHQTVLKPTKLELLTSWLPSRPWYRGGSGAPQLAKAGGFRLDDPRGEVGMEFIVATDGAGPDPVTYLVPLTYRGAPLEGAEHALVGTMEHGVLGRRWAYDGCYDSVLVEQLWALVEGRVRAQDQNVSDAPDREVSTSRSGDGPIARDLTAIVAEGAESTELTAAQGTTLSLHRILRPAPDGSPLIPRGAAGHVAGAWTAPDGTRARGLFATLYTGNGS
ncbi:1,4-alpha-glucan branching protein [Streptomyces sp. NPDC087300]|uniref:maltokinase N-terminal cap-like domain-containing protein n=1 Tax=Streptomyces sp. NPDC087300 TaxID=3365780 RepID=UPI00380106B3